MRCAAIQESMVRNVIEIEAEHVEAYERVSGLALIEISEAMDVEIGDYYDAQEGIFLRDGVEISKDGVISQLTEQMRQLRTELSDYEAAYLEGVQEA